MRAQIRDNTAGMHTLRRGLALLSVVLAWSAPVHGAQTLPPSVAERIDAIFAPFDRDGSPGYALGVVRDGQLVFAKGYGRANLYYNLPITPQTSFHLASLSKQFTAAAVALLILDGKLTLETPVATYFPEIARFHSDMRIKHLLYFTSGLPEYTTLPRTSGAPWFSFYYFTTDEAIAATLNAPALEFAPGTRWEYSNVNYMILTKIVEQASGIPFAVFLQRRIFTPLGMSGSVLDDDTTLVIPGRATGYADRADGEIRRKLESVGIHIREGAGYAQLIRVSPHFGGSGVFSTLDDLARWNASFESNRLAGPAFTTQMLQRMRFAHDKDNDAFGQVFGTFAGREMIWFSGGDLDASAFMARIPSEHLAVICLSNMPNGNSEEKARRVLDVLLAPAPH